MNKSRDPRRTALGHSVTYSSEERTAQSGVVEIDGVYVVRYLDDEGQNDLSLAGLMSRPNLAHLAGQYLHFAGLSISMPSRKQKRKYFLYFWTYLDQLKDIFGISVDDIDDFDQQLIDGYQSWLNGDKKYKSSLKIKKLTRRTRYLFVQDFYIWASETLSKKNPTRKIIFKSHQWSRAYRDSRSAEPLNALDTAKLRRACRTEILKILGMLQTGTEARKVEVAFLESKRVSDFKSLDVKIAAFSLVSTLDKVTGDAFRSKYPGLARSLTMPYGKISDIAPYVYFTWDTIVPFVLLGGLETGYNGSTQCGLTEAEVGVHPFWTNTLRLAPSKNRANGLPQVRTFPLNPSDPFSVPSLLEQINIHTAWYRPYALPRDRHRVFLVWSGQMGRPPTSLLAEGDIQVSLKRAIRRFTIRHKLPAITLSALRQTVADAVHFISDGDAQAVKTIMGHRSIKTGERSYNSSGQMLRRSSQLANAVRHRQRFVDSAGRVPLENVETDAPPSAATPGFQCWDIYNSPVLGQEPGRMCSAYGYCPDCPLSCCRRDDPHAAGRLLQLKELLEVTREQVDHIRWSAHWLPQYEALLCDWLPNMHASALATAKNLFLSPLPRLL